MARILLIDEDAGVREMVRLVLLADGHETLEAASGPTGLSLWRQMPLDIVIFDMQMRRDEAAGWVKEMVHDDEGTAVIVMTSWKAPLQPEFLLDMLSRTGPFGILPKPFGPQELLDAVRECLTVSGLSTE